MTQQRRAILDAICGRGSHPSADELYHDLRQRLPRISLATVYRNLETLASSGLVGKLEHGCGQRRFDGNPGPHHHVRCVCCGRIEDLRQDMGVPDAEGIGRQLGGRYRVVSVCVDVLVVCPGCQ
jgi:Fur family ferric uptake transcriptional regulator